MGPDEPLLNWCTACWKDRIITTNGKCRVCGTDLIKRHWKMSIKKLDIIIKATNKTPLEIKGRLYLIPDGVIAKFKSTTDYTEKIKFIEHVKTQCKSYKV